MSRIGKDGRYVQRPDDGQSPQVQERSGEGGASQTTGPASVARRSLSAADAERMVSQAGFSRTQAKKKGPGLELGDSGKGPIPLPEDDVDLAEWSMDTLAAAQAQLLQHNGKVGRSRGKAGERGLLGALIALSADEDDAYPQDDADKEERATRLRAVIEQRPPEPAAMAALAKSVQQHFGIDVGGAPVGAALMATSLLVAGHQESVVGAEGGGPGLAEDKLMGGLQQVVEEGRNAAEDARQRTEGVNRTLAMQRTFVPRR